jgi:hypothetical protein
MVTSGPGLSFFVNLPVLLSLNHKQMLMKTHLYVTGLMALLILCCAGEARAQKWFVGPKAGMSVSWLTNIEKTDYEKREPFFGAMGGFASNYSFSKNVSLQTELLFIQKGQRYKRTDIESRSSTYVNWLELPLLLQGSFQAGATEMYFNTGGYLAVALNGKNVSKTTNSSGEPQKDKSNVSFGTGAGDFNRVDAGIPFGMGWIIPAGLGNLLVDLRFEIGFVNLYHGGGNPQGMNEHWRCGTVSVSYMLPILKMH